MPLTTRFLEILAGEFLSGPLEPYGGDRLTRIGMPDSWTAAPLTFQLSPDGGVTWLNLHHALQSVTGEWVQFEVVIPRITPGSILTLPAGTGFGPGWLKIRSGTHSAPVNQTATRTFMLVLA